MQENLPADDLGAQNLSIPPGDDYEYDESHDVLAGPPAGTHAPYRVVAPPKVNLGQGGDYGYDEAHDFRAP